MVPSTMSLVSYFLINGRVGQRLTGKRGSERGEGEGERWRRGGRVREKRGEERFNCGERGAGRGGGDGEGGGRLPVVL